MMPAEIRCVVGIDVAKQTHVVCALEAPQGALRCQPSRLEAAFVAARCAPEWRVRYHGLLDRGRAKKEAFNILARALLRVIYHLLRTGDAYNPALLNQQPAPAAG